jgi:hypothetical protein
MTSVLAAHFFARVELKNSLFNMRWITIPQITILIAAWLFAAVIFTWFFNRTITTIYNICFNRFSSIENNGDSSLSMLMGSICGLFISRRQDSSIFDRSSMSG